MSVEVQRETQAVYPEIQAIRHQLHRCPELGHREVETTRLIRTCLEEYGVEVLDYGFPTGLAARIRGGHPGKLLALREDMEGRPMLLMVMPVQLVKLECVWQHQDLELQI